MPGEDLQARTTINVPDAYRRVVRSRDGAPLIDVPGDAADRLCVPFEYAEALASVDVPQPDVLRAGKRSLAISTPRNTMDVVPMALEDVQAASAGDIPYPNRRIAGSGQ